MQHKAAWHNCFAGYVCMSRRELLYDHCLYAGFFQCPSSAFLCRNEDFWTCGRFTFLLLFLFFSLPHTPLPDKLKCVEQQVVKSSSVHLAYFSAQCLKH